MAWDKSDLGRTFSQVEELWKAQELKKPLDPALEVGQASKDSPVVTTRKEAPLLASVCTAVPNTEAKSFAIGRNGKGVGVRMLTEKLRNATGFLGKPRAGCVVSYIPLKEPGGGDSISYISLAYVYCCVLEQ